MSGWEFHEPSEGPSPFSLSPDPVPGASGPLRPPAEDDETDELPETYGTQALYLVASDPGRVFAYWDLDWSRFGGDEEIILCLSRVDGAIEHRVPIQRTDPGVFADVIEPSGTYYAEVGATRPGEWRTVARSGLVTLPPGEPAPDFVPASFATVPFDQSFRQLSRLLSPFAQSPSEGLVETIARLQHEFATHGALPLDQLTLAQRSSVEMLLLLPAEVLAFSGDEVEWSWKTPGGDSSDYGAALAALRALIEGAAPAARNGRDDASSHAPGPETDALPAEWDLWRRTLARQLAPAAAGTSAPGSGSRQPETGSGGL